MEEPYFLSQYSNCKLAFKECLISGEELSAQQTRTRGNFIHWAVHLCWDSSQIELPFRPFIAPKYSSLAKALTIRSLVKNFCFKWFYRGCNSNLCSNDILCQNSMPCLTYHHYSPVYYMNVSLITKLWRVYQIWWCVLRCNEWIAPPIKSF